MSTGRRPRNIVLVHGAFVDGSSWRAVYDLLAGDGYHVAVVQNPTVSLSGDVGGDTAGHRRARRAGRARGAFVRRAVITEAGMHDKVAALVYIAAFAPDEGESVRALVGDPAAPGSPIVAVAEGFWCQDRAKFHRSFGADLPPQMPCSSPTPRFRGG